MKDIKLFRLVPPSLLEMYIFNKAFGIVAVINDGDIKFIIQRSNEKGEIK